MRMIRKAVVLFAAAVPAWCQCILCRQAAASQPPEAAHALNMAIMVLLVPAVGLFCTVYAVAVRGGSRDGAASDDQPETDDFE